MKRANGLQGKIVTPGTTPGHGDEVQYSTGAVLGLPEFNAGYDIPSWPGLEPSAFFDLTLGPQMIQRQMMATAPGEYIGPGTVGFGVGVLTGQLVSSPNIEAFYPQTSATGNGGTNQGVPFFMGSVAPVESEAG